MPWSPMGNWTLPITTLIQPIAMSTKCLILKDQGNMLKYAAGNLPFWIVLGLATTVPAYGVVAPALLLAHDEDWCRMRRATKACEAKRLERQVARHMHRRDRLELVEPLHLAQQALLSQRKATGHLLGRARMVDDVSDLW